MKPRFTAIAAGLFLLGMIGLLTPAIGQAHLVTFDFTGTLAAADPHSLGGILTGPTGPFPASTIVGSFTFEADTLDTNVSPTVGQYNAAIKSVSFSVTNIFGAPYQFGFNSAGSLNSIAVNANTTPANQSYILSASVQNTVPAGAIVDGSNYFAREFYINLLKPSTAVFASDVLPETPPGLSPFSLYSNLANQDGQFRLVFDGHGDPHTLIGNLTSLTVSAVPIPAAVYLFGSGLIGLIGVARRRMTATA
jgi:hypothetical protein